MQRLTAIACVMVLVTGCSFSMQSLRSDWDGTTEPVCDDSQGRPALDALGFFLGFLAVTGGLVDENEPLLIGGAALGVTEMIGWGVGMSRLGRCKKAKNTWIASGAIATRTADIARERQRLGRAVEASAEPEPTPKRPAAPPRGFFCTTSPTTTGAGLCARQKTDCTRARDAALAAVADLGPCTLTETAFCIPDTERCWSTAEACAAQAQRDNEALSCEERQ